MHDLTFQVESVEVSRYAITPLLVFKLRVLTAKPEESVSSVGLHCQIQIEAARRKYETCEQEALVDLFGSSERWGQTLRTLLWTHADITVPPFQGSCVVDLPIPFSFDFNVAVTKYFYALETGEIPLSLQFSGTVFFRDAEDRLQIERIPWSKEAGFRLPVGVCRDLIDHYYPNTAWVCLPRVAFDRLYRYKTRISAPSWEHALERLLDEAEEKVE